jgi:hypothetical protein
MQHHPPSLALTIPLRLSVSAVLASCITLAAVAQDWPQWGGTNHRNMYSPERGLPDRVEPGAFQRGTQDIDMTTTKNVKWVAKLGTQSYGNVTMSPMGGSW